MKDRSGDHGEGPMGRSSRGASQSPFELIDGTMPLGGKRADRIGDAHLSGSFRLDRAIDQDCSRRSHSSNEASRDFEIQKFGRERPSAPMNSPRLVQIHPMMQASRTGAPYAPAGPRSLLQSQTRTARWPITTPYSSNTGRRSRQQRGGGS
jgi:hypothetical protein